MSKSVFRTVAMAAGATLLAAASAQAVVINIQSATGSAGQTVAVGVNLSTEGAEVAGTQNDISFAAPIGVVAKANKKPDCAVNADIDKGGTSFAFQPSGCADTDTCTGIRSLVLALDNVAPIPDGSVLYACQVKIADDAAGGTYDLTNSNEGASDPDGVALDTTGTNGSVTVEGAVDTLISVGSAEGNAGGSVQFNVTLTTTQQVAGTQNDIAFDPLAPIAAKSTGKPTCAVNPDIDKGGTSFAYQPSGCTAGTDCTGIRSLVLALDNVAPIPSGSVMYSCQVDISGEAPAGDYPLTCTNPGASDPEGVALQAQCSNGKITVVGGEQPTDTPTNTPVVDTPTPASTSTNTPVPPTSTRTPKPTSSGGGNDDDGCAIVAPVESSFAWMLLLPAAGLLWLRRRSR